MCYVCRAYTKSCCESLGIVSTCSEYTFQKLFHFLARI